MTNIESTEVASAIITLGWIQDGIGELDVKTIENLSYIANEDTKVGLSAQIPHLTLLVWDLWFYRTCSLSTRRHICSDWAVKRVSGDVFESSGAPHMPNGGSLEAKEGMTRHGNSAELPSTDGLGKAAYAQGSAASADILWRALSSNSYEGWPRARRMINLLA